MRYLILVFLFTISIACLSQDHLSLQKEAETYFNKDDFDNALSIGESALNIAEVTVGKSHVDYADILCDVAIYNAYTQNFEKALSQVEESLALFKKISGESSKELSEVEENFGRILIFSGDYIQAELHMTKAVEMTKLFYGADSREYSICLGNLAYIQQAGTKKFDESEKNLLLSKAILEKRKMQDSVDYAVMLNNLGSLYEEMGEYVKAEYYFKEAAKADRKNGRDKTLDYAIRLQNFGMLYMHMGRYDDAKAMMLKDVEMKKKLTGEDSFEYAASLNNLAELYSELGNYSEAEKYSLISLKIKEKTIGTKHPDYLTGQSNLALIYERLGRTDEAFALMKKTLAAVAPDKISNPVNYAFYASNYAVLCFNEKKYEEAEKYGKEVLEIYKEQYGETYGDYTEALSNLAVVYINAEEPKTARDLLTKAISITKASGHSDDPVYMDLLTNLAGLYQIEGNHAKQEEVTREAEKLARNHYGERHPFYNNSYLFNYGVALYEQRKWEEAEKNYTQVIENDFYNLEKSFSAMSENEKGDFYSSMVIHFDMFNSLAIQLHKNNPAILSKVFNNRLATKAMLLNGSAKIRNTILSSNDPQLIDTYLKWKSQKDYLVKLYSMGKRDLALMKINIDSVENSVNSMEKELSQKTDLLSKGFKFNVSWKQVQEKLKPDEAAVEIVRALSPFENEKEKVFYMALIIDKSTKDYPRIAVMEDGYEMESQYCKQYRDAIFDTTKKENTYEHFWKKIEMELNGIKKIYFSTDGIYPKINLNSIRNPTTKKYLIEDYDFYFVSSLRDLIDRKETSLKTQAEKSITLFGFPDYTSNVSVSSADENLVSAEYLLERKNETTDRSFHLDPLPGTKKEVEDISKMMNANGWKTELYQAKEAQEQKLKSLKNPTVLHIATHGYFQKDVDQRYTPATSKLAEKMRKNPLLCSGLMMAGASNAYSVNYANVTNWAGREDGILTAFEAMNLNLDKTELVVLSACETGLGEIHNGEGVYGLQRAFMVAGANTVIMSLWTVSDAATQKLMTLFYTKWLETGDKHAAFSYAQLELKKSFPDPYFWSAFVMIGN